MILEMFQSTHPHGVRQREAVPQSLTNAKFQSTHPHGVRLTWAIPYHLSQNRFNPRTRTGCDRVFSAPACRDKSFNPRTRTGCDLFPYMNQQIFFKFQSTHPHGVRRNMIRKKRIELSCFNPRTRTGCDNTVTSGTKAVLSFNPRTRTGCDRDCRAAAAAALTVSIHAPARGATPA